MSLVALGVCGGIGAYKAVEIARGLQKRGHEVAAELAGEQVDVGNGVAIRPVTVHARGAVGAFAIEQVGRRLVLREDGRRVKRWQRQCGEEDE